MAEDVEGQVRTEELDPEREARRQLALAQIRQYPDPVLRMEARPVEDFDDDLLRLVARMKDLMQEANGVGLAATQVGVLRRVFVFAPDDERVLATVERADLHAALDRLNQRDRQLVRLRYDEDMTQEAIAHRLGIPLGTVKVRLHRVRAKLRREIGAV